jgi:thymidylate synthase
VEKEDRTGTGTKSIFGYTIRHSMQDGFPLLTTKRMAVKTMMTELKWFLKGDTNIKYLVDNGCNIWNGDAYKNYCKSAGGVKEPDYTIHIDDPNNNCTRLMTQKEFIDRIKDDDVFAEEWGELGPIYGKQWRSWSPVAGEINKGGKDQIKELIKNLKENPDSRRLMVSAWNVGELSEMTLPPCHYGFQCYVSDLSPLEIIDQAKKDGLWKDTIPEGMTLGELQKDFKTKKLSLMWNQRSVDTFLGLPFNIASYGMLLTLLAEEVGMMPGELIGNLGDTHLYSNHVEQAREQMERKPFELPTIEIQMSDILNGEFDYEIKGYEFHPSIKASLSN